jgi:hypothetical protein
MFDIHVSHIQEVLSAAAKVESGAAGKKAKTLEEAWTIFECVPVFAVYTPFRNIYSSMRDLDLKFDSKFDILNSKLDILNSKFWTRSINLHKASNHNSNDGFGVGLIGMGSDVAEIAGRPSMVTRKRC